MPKTESKARTRTSPLWNYFTIVDDSHAICNICGNVMSHSSSSSNLRKHLKRKHKEYVLNVSALNSTENVEIVELADYEIEENGKTEGEHMETVPVTNPVKKSPIKYTNIHNVQKPPLPVTKKVQSKPQNKNEMIQEAITILSNVAQTNSTPDKEEDDEFAQFGKYVSAQLRQLPILNALEIQEKFYTLLTRERISVMKNATELHSYGVKSYVEQHQCSEQHHCCHQQQSKQQQQTENQSKQNQQKQQPVTLQIESSCSLTENIQAETEVYATSSVSTMDSTFNNQNLTT